MPPLSTVALTVRRPLRCARFRCKVAPRASWVTAKLSACQRTVSAPAPALVRAAWLSAITVISSGLRPSQLVGACKWILGSGMASRMEAVAMRSTVPSAVTTRAITLTVASPCVRPATNSKRNRSMAMTCSRPSRTTIQVTFWAPGATKVKGRRPPSAISAVAGVSVTSPLPGATRRPCRLWRVPWLA